MSNRRPTIIPMITPLVQVSRPSPTPEPAITVLTRPFRPTRRQIEVLAARCASGSRRDAARILGISEATVRTHMRLLLVGAHCVDDAQACLVFSQEIRAMVK